jgi:hypothetical protein
VKKGDKVYLVCNVMGTVKGHDYALEERTVVFVGHTPLQANMIQLDAPWPDGRTGPRVHPAPIYFPQSFVGTHFYTTKREAYIEFAREQQRLEQAAEIDVQHHRRARQWALEAMTEVKDQ